MNSMRIASQRIIYAVAIFVMAVALVLPAIASAAQVTSRSVALSSASADADGVTYTVNFTPVQAAGAFVVDFCDNTPLIGQTCDAPAGFAANAAATSTAGFTVTGSTNRVVVTGSMTATPVSVTLTGINNPTDAGTLYARIVTFVDGSTATSSTPTNVAGAIDEGGVAIAITDTIGVSGVVLETLTFCVSGEDEDTPDTSPILVNCTGELTAPVLQLGEQVGSTDIYALSPGEVSDGSIFTQISTNAVSGAVVHLKSDALGCGGLKRAGAPTACDIKPALNTDVDGTAAQFGVKTYPATPTASGANPTGVFQPVDGSLYNPSTYALNWVSGDATGVTSTFGDPFLDTDDKPINNQNMRLQFAASATNDTPAGTYSAGLSLIAVGKF